jgi:signal transduction histidine kinase
MVREILEFAKGEKSNLKISEVDLQDFIDDLREELSPLSEVHKIKMNMVNVVKEKVFFDPLKIRHTILNIFKNGVEAMDRRGSKIDLKTEMIDDKLHIMIANDGPPIPEQIMDQLFEPFVTYGKNSGTGLGLAICHKTVKDHNGEMIAQNLPEGGVRFDINIPINKPKDK